MSFLNVFVLGEVEKSKGTGDFKRRSCWWFPACTTGERQRSHVMIQQGSFVVQSLLLLETIRLNRVFTIEIMNCRYNVKFTLRYKERVLMEIMRNK